ncbi:hypothetical protein WMY93_017046 [Mugilogobius chulae]|uniref:Fibulin-5 n=1 Tax=Mugilogobius chulae TaxID=88201 RepID=A0AAW0NRF0_9GOBI
MRGFRLCSSKRLLATLLFILLFIHPGHGQTCSEGFAYDRRARQCIDVDECRTIPDACRGDMRCVNQNGGYLCIPRGLYSQPYRPEVPALPEPSYPDISTGTGGFSDTFQGSPPRSVQPSYPRVGSTAPCILGYSLADDGTCTDIDECETNSHHCNPTQVCLNTAGGYTCSCTEGYWLIGGQCHDIDECRYGYCQQLCANVAGSYSCSCNPGYELNADGRTCEDVDECLEEPCSHGCFNTYGSFMCSCEEGFELAADGTTCMDYNECETGNNTCTAQQVCFNFQGGFTCLDPLHCPPPYVEVSDNQCMCYTENPQCRDKPFTILYRHMDLSSGRAVPADIFQMQATTRYPGAFYIFQIKSGNEGREFYMRQTSNVSATLVLTRPSKAPKSWCSLEEERDGKREETERERKSKPELFALLQLHRSGQGTTKLKSPVLSALKRSHATLGWTMECLKNCCKTFTARKKEPETQVITMKMPLQDPVKQQPVEQKAVSEDYLLSKMPPDGRVVPFILPTFKASYIQPKGQLFPNLQPGLQSSARCTYAERKAELLGSTYSPESSLHQVHTSEYNSPGSLRRSAVKNRLSQSPRGRASRPSEQKLSSSMFDLSSPQGRIQRFDSSSSVFSSESSMRDSIDSSLDSITLSGDERELGKVCVRVSYQEALEQVWITLVQCSDLCLTLDGGEQQKIGLKGIITVPKPIQFKSSVKAYQQDIPFMETFVFSLRLQQLRCSALVLRLQWHSSAEDSGRMCPVPENARPAETEHWLELNSPSKSSVYHSELQLSTCFQPVNNRIQLQIISAQNLPPSSSPLTQAFFVKSELHQCDHVVMKKKTKALKASGGVCEWKDTSHFLLESLDQACSLTIRLYSRSSVRRKQCLGQIILGFDSPVPEVVDQWKDMMAHPEKVVTSWHRLSPP